MRALVVLLLLATSTVSVWAEQRSVVRVASASTGGGSLAVLVSSPDSAAQDRYPEGAPVVVTTRGGVQPGDFQDWSFLTDAGFVVVQYLFPGGSDQGFTSDGVYDYRGPNCILAARDVWLFAMGRTLDTLGRSIDDVVERPVLTEIMGVSAHSNGGNLAPAVLNDYEVDLVSGVRFLHMWENGINSVLMASTLADGDADCDPDFDADGDGDTNDEQENPRYDGLAGYDFDEPVIDYSTLRWDASVQNVIVDPAGTYAPTVRFGRFFFDGNGNDVYDSRAGQASCPDTDLDGLIELTEDWRLSTRNVYLGAGQPRVHYSEAVARWYTDNPDIFPNSTRPSWVATLQETEDFWAVRAGSNHIDQLSGYVDSLRVIHSFARVEHARTAADHPSSRMQLDGFQTRSGLWMRIQPDASYVELGLGSVPSDYLESPANISIPPGEMDLHSGALLGRNPFAFAAVVELADRTYYGGWTPDLDAVLDAPGSPASIVTGLSFPIDGTTLSWTADPGTLFYDVSRADDAAFTNATCLVEDVSMSSVDDATTPAPGTALFYVVRPGGLVGTWGANRPNDFGNCVK